MEAYTESMERLIAALGQLPGIGRRTVEGSADGGLVASSGIRDLAMRRTVTTSSAVRLAAAVALSLAALLAGAPAARAEDVALYIGVQRMHYRLDGQIQVRFMMSNSSLDPVNVLPLIVETGDWIEVAGRDGVVAKQHALLLAPGLELTLDRLEGGKVVWSRRIEKNAAKDGRPVRIPPNHSQEWMWTVRPAEFTEQEGLYRLRLARGKQVSETQPFRLAKTLETPDWISLSYTPNKEEYLLGEAITVHFVLKNNGKEVYPYEYGGDYRGSHRSLRFAFVAVSDDGRRSTDPHPNSMCMGGMGGYGGQPGDKYKMDLHLLAYLRFSGPGLYTVTAYQDLEFGVPVKDFSDNLERDVSYAGEWRRSFGGTFKVRIVAPDAAGAEAFLRQMLSRLQDQNSQDPLVDLGDPLYLGALRKILGESPPDVQAARLILAVGSIKTVESTRLLVDLARHDREAYRVAALLELRQRLPDPRDTGEQPLEGRSNWYSDGTRLMNVRTAWDKGLRAPLVEIYKKGLNSSSMDEVGLCADGLFALGASESAPLLFAAADRIAPALPVSKKVRAAVERLASAAGGLVQFGAKVEPANAKSSTGRLVVWAVMTRNLKQGRADAWEDLLLFMMHQPDSMLRLAAIQWLPKEFSKRKAIPWKDLFLDSDHAVYWYAIGVAREKYPPGLRQIVEECLVHVPDKTDTTRTRDFQELLREIDRSEKPEGKD